jgi:uncharacterized RDD family membrane protein YckC
MTLAHDRTSDFLEGAKRERRQIVTPEGVSLSVELADYGERLVAFVLDLFVWFVLMLVIVVAIVSAIGVSGGSLIAISIALFIAFMIRNLYFVTFELAWRGATPGKRMVGLRVIDRAGGPLQPSAVVARNLTREIETFVPLSVLLTAGKTASGGADWSSLGIAAWMLLFAALPFINRDRMRGGDILAGTLVISLPKRVLLGDLVERKAKFVFTHAQLRAYGAFELQVLEELLRRPVTPDAMRLLTEVCDKICKRIERTRRSHPPTSCRFTRVLYAERAFLEHEQLFERGARTKKPA